MIREEIIKGFIAGKDILDVGGVGQNCEYSLWQELKGSAGSVTGIDIVPSADKEIITADMESYSFGRRFDAIILGDVLEHTDNQGLLLDNLRRHLKEEGALIITTPNAKWPTVFKSTNPTHTLWHDRATLNCILNKHGFKIIYFRYYYGNKKGYPFYLRPLLLRQQMLAICKIK